MLAVPVVKLMEHIDTTHLLGELIQSWNNRNPYVAGGIAGEPVRWAYT